MDLVIPHLWGISSWLWPPELKSCCTLQTDHRLSVSPQSSFKISDFGRIPRSKFELNKVVMFLVAYRFALVEF